MVAVVLRGVKVVVDEAEDCNCEEECPLVGDDFGHPFHHFVTSRVGWMMIKAGERNEHCSINWKHKRSLANACYCAVAPAVIR